MLSRILPYIGAAYLIYAVCSHIRASRPVQMLSAPGVLTIPVANSREDLTSLATLAPGPVKIFRLDNPSRVKVIEQRLGATLIEVIDGPRAGERGWVFSDWVSPK